MSSDITDAVAGRRQRQVVEDILKQPISQTSSTATRPSNQERADIELKEVQATLTALGYAPGPVDGILGPQTRSAIAKYQADHGLAADGRVTSKLISALRAQADGAQFSAAIIDNATNALSTLTGTPSPPPFIANAIAAALSQPISRGEDALSKNRNQSGSILPGQSTPRTAALTAANEESHLLRGDPQNDESNTPDIGVFREQLRDDTKTGSSSEGTQTKNYLDRMVAEMDAQVKRLGNDIDPQTREMAKRSGINLDSLVAGQLAGYEQYKKQVEEIKRLTRSENISSVPPHRTSTGSSQPGTASEQVKSELPLSLTGVWESKNVQFMPHLVTPGSPVSYNYTPMQLTIDPKTKKYTTRYPELGCIGQLFLEKRTVTGDKSRYSFREKLIQRSSNCTDNGIVNVFDPLGSNMFLWWTHPKTQEKAIGGTLTKTSAKVDASSNFDGAIHPAIKMPPIPPADSKCVRYSANIDYCGPSGNPKLSKLIPDVLFGPFSESCSRHDYCYYAGAEKIIKEMSQLYRASMISATDEQLQEFRGRMISIRTDCDMTFLKNLLSSCLEHSPPNETLNCFRWATVYSEAVLLSETALLFFEASAFEKTVNQVLSCPR